MKKVLSILLAVIMLFTMIPMSTFAADGITVKIVSFMRGAVDDLRSSELLEVKVEGYDGNPRELTYKWTSSLGTYLYVYNSHNMYGINNTDGEREIYNSAKKINKKNMTGSTSMAGRTYDKTFKEVGFAWASVYGADIEAGQLNGTVTVEVFDKSGKSLGSGSYTNFKDHNLDKDIDNVVIGLFEGDRMDVRDLLGQSGVVHITCSASKVTAAKVENGGEYIKVEEVVVDRNTYEYYVNGIKAGTNETTGDAQLSIAIKKEYCKFHAYTSGTANPIVYVFKKPKTTTTTTTLTLVSDIDNRCEYFINGNKGEQQGDGTIIFTGLDPNTTYTVEVRAEYNDNGKTKYVYGYVEDTTKPVYLATVKTHLDNNLTDISAIHGAGVELLLRNGKAGTEYLPLAKSDTGTYITTVENGTYIPYHFENGIYHEARGYELIVENANAELNLHHYTVKYDTTYGAFESGEKSRTEIYSSMSAVNATSDIPVYEGYIFAGWEYDNATYASGAEVTSSISVPITLTAKWVKAVDVTINVTIDHNFNINGEPGVDPNTDRSELVVDFLEMKEGSPAFVETGDRLHFTSAGVTDGKTNPVKYDYDISLAESVTTYTAKGAVYTDLPKTSAFGVAVSKSGYDVESVTKNQGDDGNWTIDIKLVCNPDDFDIDFSVEMEEGTPEELYPDAVIVKVAYWTGSEWKIISQQETTDSVTKPGVRVDIDPETGKGYGSYPVWKYDSEGNAYGYRAVVTGFIYDNSTIIVPTEKNHVGTIIAYTDGNYTATMTGVADGKEYGASLNGAYYNDVTKAQQGTLHGVISVEKYDVTFDAQGGTVNGKDKDIANNQYYIPSFDGYEPTMAEHNFLGWYLDKECTIRATEGELLTKDITLYASWDVIVKGELIVDGYYVDADDVQHIVKNRDRADYALVELEEITPDGTYNIAGQGVKIEWENNDHFSVPVEYKFTGLEPNKNYRVYVYLVNYDDFYQNSQTVINNNGDKHDDYNEDDFKAVFTEENKFETFVNTFMNFNPACYFQPVEVDATSIGKNSRPSDTLVEIMYKATGSDNAYQVISQHTVVPYGIEIGMGTNGMDDADYGYWVWNSLYDGSLYDYQANLKKINGDAVSEWPVSVVYGEPSRYSPLNNAATGVLLVRLIPNRYNINYHEYYADENTEVVSHSTHIWSYETEITYKPERDGYKFLGWYANPECTGEEVRVIAETVAADTDLYAKWEKIPAEKVSYVVEHYKQNDNGKYVLYSSDMEILTGEVGTTVTAQPKSFDGYLYNPEHPDSIHSGELSKSGTLVLKLYYDIDKIGGGENGDNGDGTPDRYQKVVIFRVVNGTWADGSAENKVYVLTLDEKGNATVTVPEGMIAKEGYEGGTWEDKTPSANVSGSGAEVYTYSFTKTYVEPENPGTPETPENPEGSGNGAVETEHHIVFGKTDGIGWYNVSQDGGKTWDIVFGNSTYEVKNGTEIIIRAGDIMGDSFTYYVNGDAVKPDENGEIRVTVKGYMLIGAIGIDPDIDFEVPDAEESLNWFQRIIKAIKDFFAKIFGKK